MNDAVTYVACCQCATPIYLPESRWDRLRETKQEFFCHNGHKQAFTGPTQAEKDLAAAKRRIDSLRYDLNECKDCERRFGSYRGLLSHRARAHQ